MTTKNQEHIRGKSLSFANEKIMVTVASTNNANKTDQLVANKIARRPKSNYMNTIPVNQTMRTVGTAGLKASGFMRFNHESQLIASSTKQAS